uniref:Serine racemase n=1 Tax=Plectus sambesii TaxID=2011161 RepID=A0A914URH6_9BILA
MSFGPKEISLAYDRIRKFVHRTPVLQSACLDQLSGKQLFLKAENLQKTGSFKARGALNAILLLKEKYGEKTPGVITQSSGNHGQALAFAARTLNVPCTVVVPSNAPKCKRDAIAAYGAKLVECAPTMTARLETCEKLAADENLVVIDPHNDYEIMAGQGSVAMELLEQVPDLDAILVPVGGGGLVSGIATWVKHVKPECKVFCVEPQGKELERCLHAGERLWADPPKLLNTVADGIRVERVGDRCFQFVVANCEKTVLSVTNEEIIDAMKLTWSRTKQTIESTSATGIAAVLASRNKATLAQCHHIGVILCGGNVDLDCLPWLLMTCSWWGLGYDVVAAPIGLFDASMLNISESKGSPWWDSWWDGKSASGWLSVPFLISSTCQGAGELAPRCKDLHDRAEAVRRTARRTKAPSSRSPSPSGDDRRGRRRSMTTPYDA